MGKKKSTTIIKMGCSSVETPTPCSSHELCSKKSNIQLGFLSYAETNPLVFSKTDNPIEPTFEEKKEARDAAFCMKVAAKIIVLRVKVLATHESKEANLFKAYEEVSAKHGVPLSNKPHVDFCKVWNLVISHIGTKTTCITANMECFMLYVDPLVKPSAILKDTEISDVVEKKCKVVSLGPSELVYATRKDGVKIFVPARIIEKSPDKYTVSEFDYVDHYDKV